MLSSWMSCYISKKLYGNTPMIEIAPEQYVMYMTLSDAILYCRFLEVDGKRDWRLPSLIEMQVNKAIYDRSMDHTMWVESDVTLFESYLRSGVQSSYTNYVVPVRTI